MTETLADWLAARSDAELAELLRLRPDLTTPVPASMNILAARADQRGSVARVADEFGTPEFVVMDAMATSGEALDDSPGLSRERIHELLPDHRDIVDRTLDRLITAGVVWGKDSALHITAAAVSVLPWSPRSPEESSDPEDVLTADEIRTALGEIDEEERSILRRLAVIAPVGQTKDAARDTPPNRPVQRLLKRRLLQWVDDQTVVLPELVARLVRDEPAADPRVLVQPPLITQQRQVPDVDGAAAGQALELLRNCADVLTVLGDTPAPVLKAGGMGVRELRRVGKQTGIEDERLALLVEVMATAGLIAAGKTGVANSPRPGRNHLDPYEGMDDFWAPTMHADSWLDQSPAGRWRDLAAAWLTMPRLPWTVGMRDNADKPIAALSDELRNSASARNRRQLLETLAELPPGTAVDAAQLAARLTWRRPRARPRFRAEAVARTLDQAATFGLVGRGALAGPARALLLDRDVITEMAAALPIPLDYVLVQADLTVVAPGPLTPDLERRVTEVADLESAGGAAVYRVSEASVRRALDAGASASSLHTLFTDHSRTRVPQALTYLIDDVARRHGKIRVGVANSFLRCDDPAQLAEVLATPVAAELALRGIAPTVAISPAPLADVLEKLRAAGFSPAGEDSRGSIVDLRSRGVRIVHRRVRQPARQPQRPTDEQLRQMIDQLRANDRAAKARGEITANSDGSRTSAAAIMSLLQLAVKVHRSVNITYIDATGTAIRRIVEPLTVGGGQLDAFDATTETIRHFPLHRIAAISLI